MTTSPDAGRPLRVLHVHSGNLFGGVERILETLACRAQPGLMRSEFALCFTGRLSRTLEACGADVVSLGSVRISRPWQMLRARKALAEALAATPPDLAVVHSAWSHWIFGSTIRRFSPLVRWLHAAETGQSWQERAAGRQPPSLVICNSHYTCQASEGRYRGVPRQVWYAPVAIAPTAPDSRTSIRRELDTPDTARVIVIAARLEPLKGHRTLIDALSQLDAALPWRCWIAGGAQRPAESSYLTELQHDVDRAGLAGRVQFLGERSDVTTMLAAADVYCQPNDGPDAYGLSFIEAMAAGLPIVSTRLGAAGEVVDASCGLLVAAHAPQDVAAALRTLLTDESRRVAMAKAARLRALSFSDVDGAMVALAGTLATARRTSIRT